MFVIPYGYGEIFTLFMYFAPALISLVALWFINKRFIWLSVPITVIADLIAFWSVLTYYETRQLALVFLIPQIIVVTAISLIFKHVFRKRASR